MREEEREIQGGSKRGNDGCRRAGGEGKIKGGSEGVKVVVI